MGELYEERRQEPRFAAAGRYRLETGRVGDIQGRILDLSLNGALFEHGGSVRLQPGAHHPVTLEFDGQPPFRGDGLLVRVDKAHIGIEFYDMDPQNFAALAALIEALDRAHR
ncbi:MAG: PilZ domain-containing protein [Proteobacteria bacterium]|nr:PilZ domain-containing protein [Pseudomonadota bacterium]